MKKFILHSILISSSFFFIVQIGSCQDEKFSFNKYFNADGDSLFYRLMLSDYDTISEYPLVVFLHGAGERGSDNVAQLKWGVENFATDEIMLNYQPIVIAPQCPNGKSWAPFRRTERFSNSEPNATMKLVRELIDDVINRFSVDTNRIYITGLSMGGYGTFEALVRYPELFAAGVPVCGGGNPIDADQIKDIPIWIFHGADDDVVPASLSIDIHDALVDLGARPGLTIYPNTGHFSWIAAYSDDQMMRWLFQQSK